MRPTDGSIILQVRDIIGAQLNKYLDKISNFGKRKARICQLHPFQAELKRMSTVIAFFEDDMPKDYRAVVKGAPETIEKLLKQVKELSSTSFIDHNRSLRTMEKFSETMLKKASECLLSPTRPFHLSRRSPERA